MMNDTRQLVVCNLKEKNNQMAQYFTETMNNSAAVSHVLRRKKRAAAGQSGALISYMRFFYQDYSAKTSKYWSSVSKANQHFTQ